jgi:hypothetical protein
MSTIHVYKYNGERKSAWSKRSSELNKKIRMLPIDTYPDISAQEMGLRNAGEEASDLDEV